MNTSIRYAIRLLVYIAAFFTPIWFLPFTFDAVDLNKQLLLVIAASTGLVLFLVDMIRTGRLDIVPRPLYWPLAGFLLAAVIGTLFSVSRFTSVFGLGMDRAFSLVSLFSIGALVFLATQTIEDRGTALRGVLTSSLAIALLFAVLQVLRIHIVQGEAFARAAFNTLGSVNTAAILGAVAIPLFLVSAEFSSRWQRVTVNVLRIVGLCSALFLLVIVNWGHAWVAAFASVLGYVAFAASSGLAGRRMKFFAFPLAVVVIGMFLWITGFNVSAIKSKLPVELMPTHSASYRIALKSLRSRPLGYGPESYAFGYDKHRSVESVNNALFQARFTDGASEIATAAVEGGIPALLAFAAFFAFFAAATVRYAKRNFDGNSDGAKLWASIFGFAAALFLYPFTTAMLFMFALVVVASVLAMSGAASAQTYDLEGKNTSALVGSVAFVAGLVGVLVAVYFMFRQYAGNVYLARAAALKNSAEATAIYVKSINSYAHDSRAYRMLSEVMLAQIADDLKAGPSGASQTEFAEKIQNRARSVVNVAVRATEINPADSQNWLARGYVYQNLISLTKGADDAAISMYRETLKRNPTSALAKVRIGNLHLNLAETATRQGNTEEVKSRLDAAETEYKEAIALYQNYGQALYNLAVVYERKGELKEAIRQFEKLQTVNPRNPSILFQLGLLYYRDDKKDDALRAWEQAVLSFPDYSNARWYLSLIREERGDLKRALDEVEAIEKFNPDNALVIERLEKLRAGIRQIIPPDDVLDQTPLNNER